jgi:hypothetical protein
VRLRAVLLGIVASLLLAAPASAFTAPELFVKQSPFTSHEAVGDWIPLSSAPTLNYIGGYLIGYRLQETGVANKFQTASLTFVSVPDGQPTQPTITPPYCIGQNGTVGDIVPVTNEIQFEGDGTYTVSVSVGPGPTGSGCNGGATTTASFTVNTQVTPELVGQPMALDPPGHDEPYRGVRAADPPGGYADIQCAIDATVNPDGSVAGRLVVPDDPEPPRAPVSTFPEPGAWTCVSRGVAEGQGDDYSRTFFGTPWSAPLRFDVLADFQRKTSAIVHPRSKRPTFEVTAQFAAASAGGKATLKLQRFVRCKRRKGYLFKKVATLRGTFDAKGIAKFRFKRPRKIGYYAGFVTFGGTRFVRAGADPFLIPLGATKRAILFVKPQAYPRC